MIKIEMLYLVAFISIKSRTKGIKSNEELNKKNEPQQLRLVLKVLNQSVYQAIYVSSTSFIGILKTICPSNTSITTVLDTSILSDKIALDNSFITFF